MEATRKNKLQAHMSSETSELRPIATFLNGDNSWLFSYPRPLNDRAASGKVYYHIVYEPWLNGSANDMSKWLTDILQPVHAAIDSPVAVDDAITEIENSAVAHLAGADKISTPNTLSEDALKVDAILLMFYLPDHVHQSTLYQFDKRIPVFATPDAMAIVKKMKHFKTLELIPSLSPTAKTWREPSLRPAAGWPSWLMPWFLPGHRAVNPAWALVWTHTGNDGKEVNESIVTSIHGSQVDEKHLNAFLESEPPTEKLVLMHGLKESGLIGVQIAFGAKSGLALYRRIQPKYWLANHDALFTYNGLLYKSVQLNDVGRTVDWALEQEQKVSGVCSKAMKPNFIKVANGECFVLV
ncbi:hypothetical protein V8C43DRAFT_291324 [Trichoderma afarasin]